MPTISAESVAAERRRLNRALALSRKRGDFITCDAPPTRLQPSAAELEAKRKHDEWKREFERKFLSGW
jgi:hypothetical protein